MAIEPRRLRHGNLGQVDELQLDFGDHRGSVLARSLALTPFVCSLIVVR
jgi:hypothetical protein